MPACRQPVQPQIWIRHSCRSHSCNAKLPVSQHLSAPLSTSQHLSAPLSTSQHLSATLSTSQHLSATLSTSASNSRYRQMVACEMDAVAGVSHILHIACGREFSVAVVRGTRKVLLLHLALLPPMLLLHSVALTTSLSLTAFVADQNSLSASSCLFCCSLPPARLVTHVSSLLGRSL